MRLICAVAAALLVPVVSLAADPGDGGIFAYIDAQGVTHYSNVPADQRFQLVIAAPRVPVVGSLPANARQVSATYSHIIKGAAAANRLEPALVAAVIVAESGGDPQAVSRRGARGLMQLMPETARRYGVRN